MKNYLTFLLVIILTFFSSFFYKTYADETYIDIFTDDVAINTAEWDRNIGTFWHAGQPYPIVSDNYRYLTTYQIERSQWPWQYGGGYLNIEEDRFIIEFNLNKWYQLGVTATDITKIELIITLKGSSPTPQDYDFSLNDMLAGEDGIFTNAEIDFEINTANIINFNTLSLDSNPSEIILDITSAIANDINSSADWSGVLFKSTVNNLQNLTFIDPILRITYNSSPPIETISQPGTPQGETNPVIGVEYNYTTTGAVSNQGHTLEYRFNWGDGTSSAWSVSTNANKIWSDQSLNLVRVEARCQTHPDKSSLSNSLIIEPILETIFQTGTPQGETNPLVGQEYTYSTTGAVSSAGHTLEYRFNWGDTSYSPWSTSTTATKLWNNSLEKTITVEARCIEHPGAINISDPLTINPTPVLTPIAINDCYDLQNMQKNLEGNYYLNRDIDCSDTSNWNGGLGFEPIGNTLAKFSGSLEGNNYFLINLYINRPDEDNIGLFGYTDNAVIQNIFLEDIAITGKNNIGNLIGYNDNSEINNCYISLSSLNAKNNVGGIIGQNSNSAISACSATNINITATDNKGGGIAGTNSNSTIFDSSASAALNNFYYGYAIGGLVGSNEGSSEINNCYAKGNINVVNADSVGGLIGYNISSLILNCYSDTSVNSSGPHAQYEGGFVGFNDNSTISQCYSTGTVYGDMEIGGFVGKNSNNGIIEKSYATGIVTTNYGTTGGFVGSNEATINNTYSTGLVNGKYVAAGFAGDNSGTITNSYCTGTTTGIQNIAGFVGYNYGGTYLANFWDYETVSLAQNQDSRDGDEAEISGKTSLEMKQQTTFQDAAWNLKNIWTMTDYPHLQMEYAYQADFNADNKEDTLWHDLTNNDLHIFLLEENTSLTRNVPTNTIVRPMRDLDNDTKDDVVLKNLLTDTVSVWLMDGVYVKAEGDINQFTDQEIDKNRISEMAWDKDYYVLAKNNANQEINLWVEDNTKIPAIPLSLYCEEAQEMIISENADFLGADWEPYKLAKYFKLSSGLGTKTIYAKFKTTDDIEIAAEPVIIITSADNPVTTIGT